MNCCYKCFDEIEIQEFIKSISEIGDCDFCGNENIDICKAEELGMFIRKGFSRAYEHVEGFSGAMWDSEEGKYIGGMGEEAGESVFDILYWTEMIFSELHDSDSAATLLEHLIDESGPTDREKIHGDYDPLVDIYSPSFVTINDLYKSEVTEEFYAWKKFKHTCKYYNRYFDLGNENSSRMNLLNSLKRIFELKSETIDKNQKLFRARKIEQTLIESENINWYKELGPAPAKYAANNRMSPSGISYTYLADNVQTTIQEIRAENEDKIILGEFRTKHELRILDLSKKVIIPKLSIFNEEYSHNDNWLEDFILDFTEEISIPISNKEKDIEYIATQVLAEFIRKLEFDGIKFESSLAKGTFNYVLFCGPNPGFSREYYDLEYFEYRDLELPYFNEWLLLDNVTENQVYQEMFLKLLNEYKEIERLKEFNLEAGSSSKTFAKFSEALGYIKELEEYFEKTYNVKDVDLEMEIEGFIKEYPSKGTGYIISVQQGFHSITITIERNLSFWEDQHSKQLYFKEKEKSFFGDSSPSIIDWDKFPF
ncbi:RES domain-containing protein [Priestia koreensis]|uniref:RES domain-containing protein n=1 Tax=Priestia koreensis TaxID=284581 RepID=UPI001F566111|nr:RES domain-containing protein [Priestia koreensis]UNL87487.1 RES domain-containing protein [Priestia koreensis]